MGGGRLAKRCYFQGCGSAGVTKEHIPPRSFFPDGRREQLLTVPACKVHNNDKSTDDQYVLAQICLNTSPANESRDVFLGKIAPQLGFNENNMRKLLAKDARVLDGGAVAYPVDAERFDGFFDALSFGLVFKAANESLPPRFKTGHVYHDFEQEDLDATEIALRRGLLAKYHGEPNEKVLLSLDFGQVKTLNKTIYSARIFGVPNFASSITIAHTFFGTFRVTSMLTAPWPAWLVVPEMGGLLT